MIVKYKHISDPDTEKYHNTERAFKNLYSPFNPYCCQTQEEFDAFTLRHLEKDKENGIIITYEIMEEENMKLHYNMNAQEWKDLLNYLTARGCNLVAYPETDNNGLFVDFKYAIIEYGGMFFSLNNSNWEFTVCKYHKVSPYEKIQSAYPYTVYSAAELIEYITTQTKCTPIKDVYKQRIFLGTGLYNIRNGKTALWRLENELAGYREKDVLQNLDLITTIRHTKDYHVLRFHSKDGNWFDYEATSHRITG